MPKLLIAFDGSENAAHAIERAAALFPGAEAVLLSVWEPIPAVIGPGTMFALEPIDVESQLRIDATLKSNALRIAEAGAELAATAGLSPSAMEVQGGPTWDGIVRAADSVAADVIVVGSRGHGIIRSAVLGSVSHGVSHHATRPVLIVHSAA